MKIKILVVCLLLAILGIGFYTWRITSDLKLTENKLLTTQQNLLTTQQDLQSNQDKLKSTENELDSNKKSLISIETQLSSIQTQLNSAQTSLDNMTKQLDLYKNTFGETFPEGTKTNIGIYDINVPSGVRYANLVNNSKAINPYDNDLRAFLKSDLTDEKLYVDKQYVCGNYAEEVHNNAEKKGIKAAFVLIEFSEGPPHAMNAFKIKEGDLVYVDCTGRTGSGINMDAWVKMSLNGSRHYSFIFTGGWYFETLDETITSIEIYW